MFKGEKIKNAIVIAAMGLGGVALAQTIGVQGFFSHVNQVFQDGFNMLTATFEDAVIGYMFDGRSFEMASFD